ncbi:MAG: hypothetical protein LBE59_09980 [Nevskiaceae bacterium]|jgi:hypothetical protein|nr:hypothetical protein [Nevskiaceae bacterium]
MSEISGLVDCCRIRQLCAAACLWLVMSSSGQLVAGEQPELSPFKSDGCSLFPDETYYGCCFLHDFAYWKGGVKADKDRADAALRDCVSEVTGKPELGALMYFGVQAGGGPQFPTTYRWGYGWRWPHRLGFAPLAAEELAQVAAMTSRFCSALNLESATSEVAVDGGGKITVNQARQICPL